MVETSPNSARVREAAKKLLRKNIIFFLSANGMDIGKARGPHHCIGNKVFNQVNTKITKFTKKKHLTLNR